MATKKWYGVKLAFKDPYSDKFWAVYISETGEAIRHWGRSDVGTVGGTFKTETFPDLATAFSASRKTLGKKLTEGYTAIHGAVGFQLDDDAADYLVAKFYYDAAGKSKGDKDPITVLESLIKAGGTRTVAASGGTTTETVETVVALPHKGDATYPRPNGETYYPRTIGGFHDVATLRTARDNRLAAVFYGAPGCGKTALIEAAFPDCYTVVGSSSTVAEDLVGRYLPDPDNPGAYIWIDGPLVKAMLEGKVFYIDETALVDATALSVVYPVMDGRDEINVEDRPDSAGGRTVVAAKGFYVVGAFNPYVPGAKMSEALWSRFAIKSEYTTDHKLCKTLGVPALAITAAIKLDKMLRDPSHELNWAPQTRELLRFKQMLNIFGEEFAIDNLIAESPLEARPVVETVVRDVFSSPKAKALVTGGRP